MRITHPSQRLKYFVLGFLFAIASGSPASFTVPIENWETTGGTPVTSGIQFEAAISWGVQDALDSDPDILPDTELLLDFYDSQFSTAVGIEFLINFFEQGITLTAGNPLSGVVSSTGQAAAVYGVAQLSGTANTGVLSDKTKYPYFSRSYAPAPLLAGSTVGTIELFLQSEGRGWDSVALLSTAEAYGISLSQSFLEQLEETQISLATYQQYLDDTTDVSVELNEIMRSGARVIVVYAFGGYPLVVQQADDAGLIGEGYVWFVGPTITGLSSTYLNDDGSVNAEMANLMRGNLGSVVFLPNEGDRYEMLLSHWQAADPAELPGGGPGTIPPVFPALMYDMGFALVLAVDAADKQDLLDGPIGPEVWTELIRAVTFDGATGFVSFDEFGDRPMPVAIQNFIPEIPGWRDAAIWELGERTELLDDIDIVWPDNSTNIPDLDIREPFDYWSCDEKEERTDRTGKTISLHTPDGDSFDDIDADYYCDSFIDCHNLSDESSGGCGTNYLVVFIVFGIITGLLILITCMFIPFVIIYGFILPRRRVRASSPIFLLVMALSGILGYASTFAWYGKPHPVACGFQPWLLGLAVVSIISALCAKTWRIWRIFNKRFSHTVISDKQLVAFYLIMVTPAIIILIIWTAVSTPTAEMKDRDGTDHYVCTTGGVTGEPGGIVFFFILVGYEAIVLLFGAFLSIVTRKVPTFFNESKLIAISIYNLGFLAVVVIPVFLVLQEFNPFGAWIIRTCAILYAFTATLSIQFLPKIIGVIIIDKGKDSAVNPKSLRNNTMASASASATH